MLWLSDNQFGFVFVLEKGAIAPESRHLLSRLRFLIQKAEFLVREIGYQHDGELVQAALDNGADSIYFGVDQLNMRARATMNFTLGDLEEIAEKCCEKGVKSYLTLNAIIYNHDLSLIKTVVNRVKESGITAIIASKRHRLMRFSHKYLW